MKLQLFNDGFRIACNDKFFVGRDDVNSDLAVRRGDLFLLAANTLVGFVIELDAEVFHVGADALAQGILILAKTRGEDDCVYAVQRSDIAADELLNLINEHLVCEVCSVVALLFVGAFLFGFVYACTTVQTPLLVRTTFGSRDYTNIYSRVSMAGTLGGVVASTFWAWVIDLPGGFSIMFVLSIVCMALCFLFGVFALGQGKKLEKTEK